MRPYLEKTITKMGLTEKLKRLEHLLSKHKAEFIYLLPTRKKKREKKFRCHEGEKVLRCTIF
jgi:hypothetical protein